VLYEYAYNSEGHLVSYRDHENNLLYEYAYDALTSSLLHVVLKEFDGDEMAVVSVVSYLYDDFGRQVGRSLDSFGDINEGTDYAAVYEEGTGNLIAYQLGLDKQFSYTYDGFYRLTEKVLQAEAFSYEQLYTYQSFTDSTGQQRATYRVSSFSNIVKTNADVATYDTESSYTYDAMGNIIQNSIIDSNAQEIMDIYYTYDDSGQLLREDNQQLWQTYVYTYDKAGNILTKKVYNYTRVTNPTAPLQTITYGYDAGEYWRDRLTSYDGQTITYDGVGNPVSYLGYDFTWENGRQLTEIQAGGVDVAAYEYSGDGIRIAKVVDGIRYEYTLDGTQVQAIAYELEETAGGVTYPVYYLLQFTYDESGSPASMRYIERKGATLTYRVDQTYYYVKNMQGDVVALTNAAGSIVAIYIYDAWGNQTVSWSTGQQWVAEMNPFRYRGYFYDTETGFYYLNSRYYDPEVGRFISADGYVSTGQGLLGNNMYAYCGNNPVMRIDPFGYKWWEDFTERVGNAYNDATEWVAGAYNDATEWVAGAYNDATKWIEQNLSNQALYDNHRFGNDNAFHEQIFSYSVTPPSFDPTEGSFGLGGLEADFYTGGWEGNFIDFSLLDFGHIEAVAMHQNGVVSLGAMASIWSPSIALSFGDTKVELSLEVGAIGGKLRLGNGFSLGCANGVGAGISVTKRK